MKTLGLTILGAFTVGVVGAGAYFKFRPKNKQQSDRDRLRNKVQAVRSNVSTFTSKLHRTEVAAA